MGAGVENAEPSKKPLIPKTSGGEPSEAATADTGEDRVGSGGRSGPVNELGAADVGKDCISRGDGRVLSAICRGRGRGSHPRGETTGSRWQSRRRGRDLVGYSRRPPQHKGRGTQRARKHQPPRLARQGTRRRLGQGKRKCTERGVQYARINFAGFRAALPQKL